MYNDPVLGALGRQLETEDRQEAQERAIEAWLEAATPFTLKELIDRMDGYGEARFARLFLALLTEQQDTSYWMARIKGVIGEQVAKEAAEEAAADAL